METIVVHAQGLVYSLLCLMPIRKQVSMLWDALFWPVYSAGCLSLAHPISGCLSIRTLDEPVVVPTFLELEGGKQFGTIRFVSFCPLVPVTQTDSHSY
jgi:hypothetical protein